MAKQIKGGNLPEANEAYNKILAWFFSFPQKELSLNNISRELGISKTTANTILKKLVKEGFLKKEVLGRTWRVSCNQDHPYFLAKKIPYNLILIYESGIMDAIHKILPSPKAVVLFGSYRKGDDVETSDIDIAVEVAGNDEPKIVELGRLPNLGYRKNVVVNLYVFSRNKIDLNMFANIANGIVLEGFLEVRP
ncbi:MAG: nucleotidyltransferase domain-containing protein [Candidatus Aenigmatarchaeota archaeon]